MVSVLMSFTQRPVAETDSGAYRNDRFRNLKFVVVVVLRPRQSFSLPPDPIILIIIIDTTIREYDATDTKCFERVTVDNIIRVGFFAPRKERS